MLYFVFLFFSVSQTAKVNICMIFHFQLNKLGKFVICSNMSGFVVLFSGPSLCICWWHFHVRHFIFINEIISVCTDVHTDHRARVHKTHSRREWFNLNNYCFCVVYEWNGWKSAFVDYTMLRRLPFQIGLNYSFINKLRARSTFSSSAHLLHWCFGRFFFSELFMNCKSKWERIGVVWCGSTDIFLLLHFAWAKLDANQRIIDF